MPVRTVDAVMLASRTAAFMSRSIKNASQEAGHRLALSMLDLTTLEGADTEEKVRAVCRKAINPHPEPIDSQTPVPPLPSAAAVCVYRSDRSDRLPCVTAGRATASRRAPALGT